MTILASAAQVIGCYGPDCTALSVSDVVARLGMPKSNASRLLRTMRDVGLLEAIGETKRYRPSLSLLTAVRSYFRSSTLLERANEVVAAISAEFGHTGYVSARHGGQVIGVSDHQGSNPLRVASNVGRGLPAAASATGRSLLARLSDEEVRALHADGLEIPSPNAPQSVDELIARLAEVRRTGLSTSNDESTRGVYALAVAVGDPQTGEEVSLCIVCPAATTEDTERQAIAAALLNGARAIAAMTGDTTLAASKE